MGRDSSNQVTSSTSNQAATSNSGTTSFNADDIISSVVSQVQPLISQTVSSAVAGSTRNSGSRRTIAGSGRTSGSRFSSSSRPAQVSGSRIASNPAGAASSGIASNAAGAASSRSTSSSSSGSLSGLFGNSGEFSVRINTPTHQIEY